MMVQVDVAETTGGRAGASRCDVRLVPSVGQLSVEDAWASVDEGVSAVVILRNATPSSVFSCVRAAVGEGDESSRYSRPSFWGRSEKLTWTARDTR